MAAANSWSPDPAGLQELLGCFKQAEVGDSATQRAVLQVSRWESSPARLFAKSTRFADLDMQSITTSAWIHRWV